MSDGFVKSVEANGVMVEFQEVDGGIDVEMTFPDGLEVAWCEDHAGCIVAKLRSSRTPMIGRTYTIGHRTVVVTRREYDKAGHCFVWDEQGNKMEWA